jgi:hypothetical protein
LVHSTAGARHPAAKIVDLPSLFTINRLAVESSDDDDSKLMSTIKSPRTRRRIGWSAPLGTE